MKDDDERLSFLLGNYVTLTNLTEAEMERIVRYRIMPINISVHTTNPELRCAMLHNRFAGSIVESLRYFADNGIGMNGQIVLCPGYNDGDELSRTLNDLMGFYPQMASVSVVPVGLSKYREGLAKLDKFDAEGARETLSIISDIQDQMRSQYGTNFVYASDEFFLLAGEALPDSSYYDGFPQIENGVGMMTDFKESLDAALSEARGVRGNDVPRRVGIITGRLAADFMRDCAQKASAVCGVELSVYPVTNDFFGEDITVSGLITGVDIIRQVPPGADRYLIPENMVRSHTHDLLDDVTTEDIEKALQAEVRIVPVDGAAFLEAMK